MRYETSILALVTFCSSLKCHHPGLCRDYCKVQHLGFPNAFVTSQRLYEACQYAREGPVYQRIFHVILHFPNLSCQTVLDVQLVQEVVS